MSLKTKNAFITGGASGFGKSFANSLLAAGAKVVFGDVNADNGKATEKELGDKYGAGNVFFVQVDVTDHNKFEEAFKKGVEKLGFIDLMVNNAGIMDESRWEQEIQVNFAGMVKGSFLAMDHMRKDKGGKGGRVVNICSEQGIWHYFYSPVYCGTKHAIRAFTTCMAEMPNQVETGVEFAIVSPGAVITDLTLALDAKRVWCIEHIPEEYTSGAVCGPIEKIAEAFMRLVTLENMNGKQLYAHKDESEFFKIEKVKAE